MVQSWRTTAAATTSVRRPRDSATAAAGPAKINAMTAHVRGSALIQINPQYPTVDQDKKRQLLTARQEPEAEAPAGSPRDPFQTNARDCMTH